MQRGEENGTSKKIQDQRKDLVDKVVKDIEEGKPFSGIKGIMENSLEIF